MCGNAVYLRRNANFHEFAPPAGFVLEPGKSWRFTVDGLLRPARHRTDGAKSAYVSLADGTHRAVDVGDLMLDGRHSEPAPVLLPEGKLDLPFSIQPWPAEIDAEPGEGFPVALFPTEDAGAEEVLAVETVLSLFRRLFAVGHVPFSLAPVHEENRFVSSSIAVWKPKAIASPFRKTRSLWNIRPLPVCNMA